MSSTPPAPAGDTGRALAALRDEIDALDDALHDLLVQRAAVVQRVGALGAKGGVALRPGREASILRRLLGHNRPPLPAQAVVRVWRELLAATTAMQGRTAIAVQDAGDGALAACAREHFGALTPVRLHRSHAQALAELRAGTAMAAVMPLPAEDASWWTALFSREAPVLHVVARLPFWARRPEGVPRAPALVVAAAAPDPSGADRSLLGLEPPAEMSHARLVAALAASGFEVGPVLMRREAGLALAEVAGFTTGDDIRLAGLDARLRAVVLGAYAVPWEDEG